MVADALAVCFILVLHAMGSVAQTPPTIKCPANVTVWNVTACAAEVYLGKANVTSSTNYTSGCRRTEGPWFPLGETAVVFYANNTFGNVSCTTYVNVIETDIANYSACAYEGVCSTTYPYLCTCLSETAGDFCCEINSGNDTCSGHGACGPTGVCDCDPGYAGVWCCPTGILNSTSAFACGGNGCCTSDGTCACTQGFSGTACLGGGVITFEGATRSVWVPLVATAGSIIGVAIIGAAVVAYNSAAAGGAAGFVAIGARAGAKGAAKRKWGGRNNN